jgi:uncharacterized membrane protein YfcA
VLYVLLVGVAFLAGAQNALAGGGSFLTFPALLAAGLGARAANITSTVALFPGQIATGWSGRAHVAGVPGLSVRTLAVISVIGGAAGALLLLNTSEAVFQRLVPFLILFATSVFAWGSFFRKPNAGPTRVRPAVSAAVQFAIAVYGGYFGGGIGILLIAALTLAGQNVRTAGATKNAMNAVLNAAAVLIFAFSRDVRWDACLAVAVGAIAGGQAGAWLLLRVNERLLRLAVIFIGLALTVAMFLKAYA